MRTAIVIALAGFLLTACETATPILVGERIEMGPYTFSVISVAQGNQWESVEGTYREIIVHVRILRDDTKPFSESFSSSFVDSMRIVDAAGNSIGTSPTPVFPIYTAGRYRSEYYTCRFRYSRSSDGVRSFDKIGTRPQDFKLLISNPAHEGSQPHRVSIQLG
jgi:hypothetical protein